MDPFLDLDLLPSKQYCKFGGPKNDPKKRDGRTDARTDEQTHTKNLRLSTQKPLRGKNVAMTLLLCITRDSAWGAGAPKVGLRWQNIL